MTNILSANAAPLHALFLLLSLSSARSLRSSRSLLLPCFSVLIVSSLGSSHTSEHAHTRFLLSTSFTWMIYSVTRVEHRQFNSSSMLKKNPVYVKLSRKEERQRWRGNEEGKIERTNVNLLLYLSGTNVLYCVRVQGCKVWLMFCLSEGSALSFRGSSRGTCTMISTQRFFHQRQQKNTRTESL